jgi:hypothetical protein
MGRRPRFSWRRASGLSAAKGRLSRQIGIPLTASGRRQKIQRLIWGSATRRSRGGTSANGSLGCAGTLVLGFIGLAVIGSLLPHTSPPARSGVPPSNSHATSLTADTPPRASPSALSKPTRAELETRLTSAKTLCLLQLRRQSDYVAAQSRATALLAKLEALRQLGTDRQAQLETSSAYNKAAAVMKGMEQAALAADPDVRAAQSALDQEVSDEAAAAMTPTPPPPPAYAATPANASSDAPSAPADAAAGTSSGAGSDKSVYVHGYYRKDGTYVRPHYRSAPGSGGGRRK